LIVSTLVPISVWHFQLSSSLYLKLCLLILTLTILHPISYQDKVSKFWKLTFFCSLHLLFFVGRIFEIFIFTFHDQKLHLCQYRCPNHRMTNRNVDFWVYGFPLCTVGVECDTVCSWFSFCFWYSIYHFEFLKVFSFLLLGLHASIQILEVCFFSTFLNFLSLPLSNWTVHPLTMSDSLICHTFCSHLIFKLSKDRVSFPRLYSLENDSRILCYCDWMSQRVVWEKSMEETIRKL